MACMFIISDLRFLCSSSSSHAYRHCCTYTRCLLREPANASQVASSFLLAELSRFLLEVVARWSLQRLSAWGWAWQEASWCVLLAGNPSHCFEREKCSRRARRYRGLPSSTLNGARLLCTSWVPHVLRSLSSIFYHQGRSVSRNSASFGMLARA